MMQRTLLLPFLLASVSAFFSSYSSSSSRLLRTSSLCGIAEWRDLVFDFPGTGDDRRLGMEQGAPPRKVCVLPFPYAEVLLQGETKQLRLYEERFIQLFEDCMANYSGVVGMGLLAESGMIQTMPLCEMEAYNRMGGGFGIFVTIRVVGRAKLVELVQPSNNNNAPPYIQAVCTEIVDGIPPNLDLPNLVASNIENFMLLLSSMEHRLAQATEQNNHDDDNDDEMQRRINVAKLEDRFYANDGDDEEEDGKELDRRGRFRQAYQVALNTDTQGYFSPQQEGSDRTPQELTAISWAAFCTEVLPEEDATFRIQALDSESLLDRLKLASYMLQEKKSQLQTKLIKAGLRADDEDSS